jgi:heterodisulfide reductase subunit B
VIFSYYPGCSLRGVSRQYDSSTTAVCAALDVGLEELPDWTCCGASSAHGMGEVLAVGLPARNVKIAERVGRDVVVPCAACYNRLKVAEHALRTDEPLRREMRALLDYDFQDTVEILNILQLLRDRVGLDALRSRVVTPLAGLRVACYYGCLLVRPPGVTHFDDPEHPEALDAIMEAVGADPRPWSSKTDCCGGSLVVTRDDIVGSLVDTIVAMARDAGADAIVTLCPLCRENVELRQTGNGLPVLYVTELLGIAFGIGGSAYWLQTHLIDPRPLLETLRLLS